MYTSLLSSKKKCLTKAELLKLLEPYKELISLISYSTHESTNNLYHFISFKQSLPNPFTITRKRKPTTLIVE